MNPSRKRSVPLLALIVMLAAGARAATAPWAVQSSPHPSDYSELDAVSAASGVAWAVGTHVSNTIGYTLIEFYNGSAWSKQRSPNGDGGFSALHGVKATSTTNVWAVGQSFHFTNSVDGKYRTLILHNNGSGWKGQGSVSYVGVDNSLQGIAAWSATDAWAVGWRGSSPEGVCGSAGISESDKPLIEHYDGTGWRIQQSPTISGGAQLFGVAAASASEAWAVGCKYDLSGASSPLILHYQSGTWTQHRVPNTGGVLNSVSVRSAFDVWAVGSTDNGLKTLIEHYDGVAWKVVHSPSFGTSSNSLQAVKATSATNAWAVGGYYSTKLSQNKTLILHWDGTAWTEQTSQTVGPYGNLLNGLGATSATNAFAVGITDTDFNRDTAKTLVEHCCR